jgi:acetylornithine deacetylase/succinyl-diaminopimelate desuccinylase-like protein
MSRSRELLHTLVGFDTTSRESNLHLIEFVRDYLAGFGVSCELVYNDERSKANLFASIGPSEVPGIVLSGHTDVVPVDGQPWTTPPFELTETRRQAVWPGHGRHEGLYRLRVGAGADAGADAVAHTRAHCPVV